VLGLRDLICLIKYVILELTYISTHVNEFRPYLFVYECVALMSSIYKNIAFV
jgi:hypothetical protein